MSDRERDRTVSGDTRKRERSRTPSGFLARKYPKYNTKFNVAWKKDFKWLKESDKGPDYALCVLCDIHIKTCYTRSIGFLNPSICKDTITSDEGKQKCIA